MVRKNMTMPEICREGIEALMERLGPDGAIRFLQHFESGRGDYTKDRRQWLDGLTTDQIAEAIKRRKLTP